MSIGRFGRRYQFFRRRSGTGVGDILRYRRREQDRFLQDDSELLPQVSYFVVPYIDAVEPDPALIRVIKTGE